MNDSPPPRTTHALVGDALRSPLRAPRLLLVAILSQYAVVAAFAFCVRVMTARGTDVAGALRELAEAYGKQNDGWSLRAMHAIAQLREGANHAAFEILGSALALWLFFTLVRAYFYGRFLRADAGARPTPPERPSTPRLFARLALFAPIGTLAWAGFAAAFLAVATLLVFIVALAHAGLFAASMFGVLLAVGFFPAFVLWWLFIEIARVRCALRGTAPPRAFARTVREAGRDLREVAGFATLSWSFIAIARVLAAQLAAGIEPFFGGGFVRFQILHQAFGGVIALLGMSVLFAYARERIPREDARE